MENLYTDFYLAIETLHVNEQQKRQKSWTSYGATH